MEIRREFYTDACGALRRKTLDEKLEEVRNLCERAYWEGYRLGRLHASTGHPSVYTEGFGEDNED